MKKVKTQKRNVVKGTACNGIDCKLNHIGVCNKFECDMVAFQPHLHHDLTPPYIKYEETNLESR